MHLFWSRLVWHVTNLDRSKKAEKSYRQSIQEKVADRYETLFLDMEHVHSLNDYIIKAVQN